MKGLFFEVRTATGTYDCRSMGLGELAACYLWWSLERVSENSILLIEEPESFLSPMCQSAFAATLAKYTATRKPFVIATTPPPQIIQAAPKDCLRFVFRAGPNLVVNEGEPIELLLKTVGIESTVKTIILLEDAAALNFSKLWIGHFAPEKMQGIEFIFLNGDGKIKRALNGLPENPKSITFIGLYDGDAEGKGKAGDRVAFLPGQKPIEMIYRAMLETEMDRVGPILDIPNLRQILSAIQGQELHEWFELLRLHSNLSSQQLHFILFKAWIAKEENSVLAERYFGQLNGKLNLI